MKVPIEVSARHVHLSVDDLTILFGQEYQLIKDKQLSQPNQFACEETVDINGPKGIIKRVRVISPIREQTQLEISLTDARNLGVDVPIKVSGDLANSGGGAKLMGPKGEVDLRTGIIIAQRHLHIEPKKAQEFGVNDGDKISIKTTGARSIIFNEIAVRSRQDKDVLTFHIDTDEANASGVKSEDWGEIVE